MHPHTQARMELESVSPPASESVKPYAAKTVYSEGTFFLNLIGFARETGDSQIMQDLLAVSSAMIKILEGDLTPGARERAISAITALEASASRLGLGLPHYFGNLLKLGPRPEYGHVFRLTAGWIESHARRLIDEIAPAPAAAPASSQRRRMRRIK